MWSLTEHLPVHLVGNGEVGWKEKELLEIKKLNRELENPTEELKDKTEDISRKKIQKEKSKERSKYTYFSIHFRGLLSVGTGFGKIFWGGRRYQGVLWAPGIRVEDRRVLRKKNFTCNFNTHRGY